MKSYFNGDCAQRIATVINSHRELIDAKKYAARVDSRIADLGLKARVLVLAEELRALLPDDYTEAVQILIDALERLPELREGQGMFSDSWYLMPVARFVEEFGLDHPEVSLDAIESITRRHTGEYAIRPYVREHYDLTMAKIGQWSQSDSHNVRRLATEGIRPRLPWHSRLANFVGDPTPIIEIIEHLVEDPSRYVRTSVANNLNDISKDHPQLAIDTAHRWLDNPQTTQRTQWVVTKGLRTLIKKGHNGALAVVGADADPNIAVSTVDLDPTTVTIGQALNITAQVTNSSDDDREVIVDYTIHFRRATGKLSPITFKLGRRRIARGATETFSKKHVLKRVNARTYHAGTQAVTVQANGSLSPTVYFDLEC